MEYSENLTLRPSEIDHEMSRYLINFQVENDGVDLLPRGLTSEEDYSYAFSVLQGLLAIPPMRNLLIGLTPFVRKTKKTLFIGTIGQFTNQFQLDDQDETSDSDDSNDDPEEVPVTKRLRVDSPITPESIISLVNDSDTAEDFCEKDPLQFLESLLKGIDGEMTEVMKLSHWTPSSPIRDIFGGRLRQRTQKVDEPLIDTLEPFFVLSLDGDSGLTLQEALRIFSSKKFYLGDNLLPLEDTEEIPDGWQQNTFEVLPEVLVIHLNYSNIDFNLNKIYDPIRFPAYLGIDPKLISSKCNYLQDERQYKLYSIVYRYTGKGSPKERYSTDTYYAKQQTWVRFNDSIVKAIESKQVLGKPKGLRIPYLLFYYRRT